MNRLIWLACTFLSLSISMGALAKSDQFEEERLDKQQIKMIQERMEAAPASATVGGSRSGHLSIEKQRDQNKMQYELEKQRQLYEYEDKYRTGL